MYTCAACGSFLDKVSQLTVADEGALCVLAVAVEADVWVQVALVHIWPDEETRVNSASPTLERARGRELGATGAVSGGRDQVAEVKDRNKSAGEQEEVVGRSSPIHVLMLMEAMKPS